MSDGARLIPPRNGEGDRPAQPGGGGVFATIRRTIDRARRERRSGNLPEVVLWRALRTRPAGLKFRRQHPLGSYCLDFACLSARLAIEVDGKVHGRDEQPLRDHRRDAEVATLGFRRVRIPARDVLQDVEAVVRLIVAACGQPLHQPAAGPPPRSGEVSEVLS